MSTKGDNPSRVLTAEIGCDQDMPDKGDKLLKVLAAEIGSDQHSARMGITNSVVLITKLSKADCSMLDWVSHGERNNQLLKGARTALQRVTTTPGSGHI